MGALPIVSPGEQLCAPLLIHMARRMRTEGDAELAGVGLKARHVIALTLLRDFGEQKQADLAQMLGVDPTNVVALLNELEAADLIVRQRSAQDRRRHTVSLTATGTRRLGEVEQLLGGVEQRVLAALTPDEQKTLYTLLLRATANPTCAEVLDTTRAFVED